MKFPKLRSLDADAVEAPVSEHEAQGARDALRATMKFWLLIEARYYDDSPAPEGTDFDGFVRMVRCIIDTELRAAMVELRDELQLMRRHD